MIAALVVLWASLLPSQTWEWDEAERATSYRLYWSDRPDRWCEGAYVEVPADCVEGRCQGDGDFPESVFLQVIAVSEAGVESAWETAPRVVC